MNDMLILECLCLSSEVPLLILEMYKLEGQLLLSSHSFFAISEFGKDQFSVIVIFQYTSMNDIHRKLMEVLVFYAKNRQESVLFKR